MPAHTLRASALAAAALSSIILAAPRAALAQEPVTAPAGNRWELLASSGALVPTGAQRDAIKDAALSTVQVSYVVGGRVAITSMVGWARSRDLVAASSPKLDVFTYDLGAEARGARRAVGGTMTFVPFAGAGAGARSYNHRKLDVDASHDVAGYGALGGELGRGRFSLRLEVRDYLTGFQPLIGDGATSARNDVVALVGLRFARRGS